MQGWITMHRKLIEWEWYKDSKMVHLFLHLLLLANHDAHKWQGIDIKRGQVVTGLKALKAATGISTQTLRTCLSRLEKTGELTSKSTNKFRVITLCNYSTYQSKKPDTNKQPNKQLTINQQSTNNQLTSNNNVNNLNNENNVVKKIKGSDYTLQQVENAGFKAGVSDDECKIFYDHYNSQGWKKGNGLPITDLVSQLTNWRNNGHKFDRPKAEPKKEDQQIAQWEQRFGDVIRGYQADVVMVRFEGNLRNPDFRDWIITIKPDMEELLCRTKQNRPY